MTTLFAKDNIYICRRYIRYLLQIMSSLQPLYIYKLLPCFVLIAFIAETPSQRYAIENEKSHSAHANIFHV